MVTMAMMMRPPVDVLVLCVVRSRRSVSAFCRRRRRRRRRRRASFVVQRREREPTEALCMPLPPADAVIKGICRRGATRCDLSSSAPEEVVVVVVVVPFLAARVGDVVVVIVAKPSYSSS
jgi:hypothetical protein